MSTLVEIQQQFNDALLSGVSYAITNHPILGWNSDFGLVKGIAAVCFLIATIDVASKIADSKAFITGFLKTIFLLIIVLANFGQIDHRKFLPFDQTLKSYGTDYIMAPEPAILQTIFGNNKNARPMKPTPQLDRDIYNVLKGFFDQLGDKLAGTAPGDDQKNNQQDIQASSIRSTIYFLTQVRIAKMKCLFSQDKTPDYGNCLAQYIPTSDPDPKNTGLVNYADANACNGQKCKGEVDAVDTAKAGSGDEGGLTDKLFAAGKAMTEGLVGIFTLLSNLQLMVYYVIADIVFLVAFPVILWALDVARSLFSAYVMLTIGFKTAGMLFFAKILSPLILIDSKRNDVFSSYKQVFSMALFNFISKLFISFATILAIGLKQAVFEVIAKSIDVAKATGGSSGVDMTANLGTLMFLVYISIFVVLFIQILAISKIESACNALMNWSVTEFVAIGKELGGSAAKLAMVASAGVMLAPFAAVAAAAAAPALAAGAASLAGGIGSGAMSGLAGAKGALSGIGGNLMKGGIKTAAGQVSNAGSALAGGARTAANAGIDAAGKVADFTHGGAAGDRVRGMFGGSGVQSPDSFSADPKSNPKTDNNKKRGGGSDDSGSGSGDSGAMPIGGGEGSPKTGGGDTGSSGAKSKSNESEKMSEDEKEQEKAKKAKEKRDHETPGFMKNKWLQPGIMGLKAFNGVLGLAEAGASGSITNPLAAKAAFDSGYQSSRGLASLVNHDQFSNTVNDRVSEAAKNFTDRALDRHSDDTKMTTHNGLKDSVMSTQLGDLDATKEKEFDSLLKAVQADPKNNESVSKLYMMANNYNLKAAQSGGLEYLLRQESQVKSEFAKKQSQEKLAVQKYLSDPTVRNANSLTQGLNDGTISRQAIMQSSGEISAVAEKTTDKSFQSAMKSADSIDVDRYKKDDDYRKSKEVQMKEKQMESLIGNDHARSQLIGQNNFINKLEKMGKINPNEAVAMKSFESKNDAENTINSLKSEIDTLKKTSYLEINKDLKIAKDDNSNVFIMNGNQIAEDGISLSQIQDISLKEKLKKYKAAVDIIINDPSYVSKKIVSADQIQTMKQISDLIKE